MTGVFVLIGCLWAPWLDSFGGIFNYIQEVWGFISPGIVAVFLFGLAVKRAPSLAAVVGLLLTCPLYALYNFGLGFAFLNAMVFTVLTIWAVMGIITAIMPLSEPKVLPVNTEIDLTASPGAKIWGAATVAVTVALYVIFR